MGDRAEHGGFRARSLSPARLLQADWLELGRRQHSIHALLEADIGPARRSLKTASQGPVSFSAFIVYCVSRAVDEDRQLHALRQGRRVLLFDEVDVTVIVEKKLGNEHMPLPFIIRDANHKSPQQISAEIRQASSIARPALPAPLLVSLWLCLPRSLRLILMRLALRNPFRRKRLMGTVAVSTLSMFGSGRGWGIPLTAHTLCVTTGGILRPQKSSEAVGTESAAPASTEMMCFTLSFDHDLVDGAPAARFAERLRKLLEQGL